MILKGSQRGGGMQLARHLLNLRDNDHVELHELRGFVSDDLMGAFKETQAISLGTKCAQFLFSLSLSPPELENVPVSVFENAIETIEKKIGLTGQPRAIVFHEKAGRRHAHCVWSRIDAERMRAINLPHFKLKLQDISRELYVEHQWQMPAGLQDKTRTDRRNYTQAEAGQAKRVKTDPKHLKALFQMCWESSDCKTAFAHALREQGFILAKGDRRGFVAVDAQGEIYSISRWVGIKAKEVRARLGEPDDLPTVEQAHALIKANLSESVTVSREETKKLYDAQLHKLEAKRHELIKQQRHARDALKQAQQARLQEQATHDANRLPTGLTATWSKLIGQYQKILDENVILRQEAIKRAEVERQQLIQLQLKERQGLQQEIRQFKLQHEIATKSLWKEAGNSLRHLHIDPDQPLVIPVDQEALTLAEKVRQQPETILEVISDKKETFTRNDILRRLSDYIEDPADYQMAIEQVFQSKQLIQVENEPSPRYTTRELQTVKATLQKHTQAMNKTHHHGVKASYARSAIEQQNTQLQKTVGASLSNEQQDAIEHVLKGNQLSTVIGYAGAGKSTMLSAAKHAWEKQGYRVLGAALSGKAADGLETSSGIESRTLASFEQSWKNNYHTLQSNDVLVIDEAGMVGTRQMARFVEQVKKAGAKLVLVGDPEQLQPIQAGTPFKEITEKLETTTLTEIRRQKEGWQRQASIDLAKGNIQKALMAYEEKGCVKISEETDDAISHLVEDYMADMALHGTDLSRLALAHRRKDVHKINQAIRSARKHIGALSGEKIFNTKQGPRALAKNDRLIFTQNDRELGVRNGMLGTVESVAEDQITVCLDSDGGNQMKKVTINPKQYDAYDHGYATTIHKSQGATVDRAFVLTSSTMDKHLTYVAMSRHKNEVNLYGNEIALKKISRLERVSAEYVSLQRQRQGRLKR